VIYEKIELYYLSNFKKVQNTLNKVIYDRIEIFNFDDGLSYLEDFNFVDLLSSYSFAEPKFEEDEEFAEKLREYKKRKKL
jgi:hypothetical protein